MNDLPGLASNCDPTDLCLLSSWDYRHELQAHSWDTVYLYAHQPGLQHSSMWFPRMHMWATCGASGWEVGVTQILSRLTSESTPPIFSSQIVRLQAWALVPSCKIHFCIVHSLYANCEVKSNLQNFVNVTKFVYTEPTACCMLPLFTSWTV
jgi:hypothetical protein